MHTVTFFWWRLYAIQSLCHRRLCVKEGLAQEVLAKPSFGMTTTKIRDNTVLPFGGDCILYVVRVISKESSFEEAITILGPVFA